MGIVISADTKEELSISKFVFETGMLNLSKKAASQIHDLGFENLDVIFRVSADPEEKGDLECV